MTNLFIAPCHFQYLNMPNFIFECQFYLFFLLFSFLVFAKCQVLGWVGHVTRSCKWPIHHVSVIRFRKASWLFYQKFARASLRENKNPDRDSHLPARVFARSARHRIETRRLAPLRTLRCAPPTRSVTRFARIIVWYKSSVCVYLLKFSISLILKYFLGIFYQHGQ